MKSKPLYSRFELGSAGSGTMFSRTSSRESKIPAVWYKSPLLGLGKRFQCSSRETVSSEPYLSTTADLDVCREGHVAWRSKGSDFLWFRTCATTGYSELLLPTLAVLFTLWHKEGQLCILTIGCVRRRNSMRRELALA